MDTEWKLAQKVNFGEKKYPAAPAGIQTGNFSIKSPTLYQTAIPAPSVI